MEWGMSPPETAQSPPIIQMTDPLHPSLMFFISNLHNLIPIKLNEHNYTIWKLQCEGALKASSLFAYIEETQDPSPTIVDSTGNSIANPVFYTWFVVGSQLRSCLIATLTPDILTQVTHTSTARDLWVFLKQKFEKSSSSENFSLQPSDPVICQICNNSGHIAFDCGNRFVENVQPDSATMASFSPSKTSRLASDCLAIADGSAVSDANTGSDVVPPSHGTTVLFEPEMSALNQSDNRFVKDRLALLREEIMGCHTRQGSGNSEPFQKKSEIKISDAQENVILMTQAEKNLSGLKRKAFTPPTDGACNAYSDSSKKNKMVCFSANCEQSSGNNNDIRLPPKETGDAIEHTHATDDQQIQNSQEQHLEGKSLQVHKQLKGGKGILREGTTDDPKIQNSQEILVERNSVQVNKQLNGDRVIVTAGTTDDLTIQNSQEIQVEGNSLQVNKQLNGDKFIVIAGTTDDPKIQNSQELQKEVNSLQVNKQFNGDEVIVIAGTTEDLKIQNSREIHVQGNSVQVNKQMNGVEAIVLEGTTNDPKIQNSQEIQVEGNSLQVNKQMNCGEAIVFKGTTDDQKIQNSQEIQVEGNSLQVSEQMNGGEAVVIAGTSDDPNIQNSEEMEVEGNPLQVSNQLIGDEVIVIAGTSDDPQIQNSQELQVEVNSLQVNKQSDDDKVFVIAATTDNPKVHNSQEIQVEVNSLLVNKQLNGDKAIVIVETNDDPENQNSQEVQVEGTPLQVNKQLNGDEAIESVPVRQGRWITWSRPPPGKVALHFDGSVRDGSAAAGGVFRDHDGLFIAAFSVHLGPGMLDEAEAEAEGLRTGLRFAQSLGIRVDCIYGDSSLVVEYVTGTVVPRQTLWPLFFEIWNLLSGAVIAHTEREGNVAADALADFGHGLWEGSFLSYLQPEELPPHIRWLLFQDSRNIGYFKPE